MECITIFWPRYRDTRDQLELNGTPDFRRLLTEKEGIARWWLRRGILNQFKLVKELIDGAGHQLNCVLCRGRKYYVSLPVL
jgi:hypothetical protein